MASTDLSQVPSSLESIATSEASFMTSPDIGNKIHVLQNGPQDRFTFDPGLPTPKFPVKVYFLKRFVDRRAPGLHGTTFRWHLRIEEAFPRAFSQ
jgi:hypothetical protein